MGRGLVIEGSRRDLLSPRIWRDIGQSDSGHFLPNFPGSDSGKIVYKISLEKSSAGDMGTEEPSGDMGTEEPTLTLRRAAIHLQIGAG